MGERNVPPQPVGAAKPPAKPPADAAGVKHSVPPAKPQAAATPATKAAPKSVIPSAAPVWAADVERRVRQGRNSAVVASTIIAIVVAGLAVGIVALLRDKPAETLVTAAHSGTLAAGGVSIRVEYQEYQWQRGADPVRMIRKEDGFCYLTQLRGEFAGMGEQVRVYIGDDGFWYLGGNAQKQVSATAMSVRFVSQPFSSVSFPGKEGWPEVLARLAAGEDAQLRELAKSEQQGPPADAADRATLAGLWDRAAAKVPADDRPRLVSHAIELYEGAAGARAAAGATTGAGGANDAAAQLRRLREAALNDLAQWRPQSGRWEATPDGQIRGVGNAALLFAHQIPRDCTLEFHLNVIEGMRPRVRFPGSAFFVGNEGYERILAAHGTTSVQGAGVPYRNKQEMKVAIKFAGENFELSIDDAVVQRGTRRTPPESVGLLLEAGDFWSSGDTLFWGFKLAPAR